MNTAWQEITESLHGIYSASWLWLLYVAALVWLCFSSKRYRRLVVWPSILLMIFILNPVCYSYLWKPYLRYVYWRAFWLFPVVPVIAIACVDAISRTKQKQTAILLALVCGVLIVGAGKNVYSNPLTTFGDTSNVYKLPQDAIDIADFLLEEEQYPRVVVEQDLYNYLRQISAEITLLYGRNAEGYISGIESRRKAVLDTLMDAEPDLAYVRSIMQELQFRYLVKSNFDPKDKELIAQYAEEGFEKIGQVGAYGIFRMVEAKEGGGA